jgi:alginate O-acetyltransferase complex protein AlgI
VNLAIVMLLGGLWHGAAWNFVVWGGFHGALLALERGFGRRTWYQMLPRPARVMSTFAIVLVGWVFFRAPDLASAVRYLESMFGMNGVHESASLLGGILYQPYYLATFGTAAAVTWGCPQTWNWTRRIGWWKAAAIGGLLAAAIGALATQAHNPFIYFIF